MFSALVDYGQSLEQEEEFPHPGFYFYSETSPIRWTVHYSADRVHIEEATLAAARPFSGRTSGLEAHFLVDEASYALGVSKQKKGDPDKNAERKHELFVELLKEFASTSAETAPDLAASVRLLLDVLDKSTYRNDPRFDEIESKQWISFSPLDGPLQGQRLFELPEARSFWTHEMEKRCAQLENGDVGPAIVGECAVCGQGSVQLVGKLPLKVKLTKTSPIHSLNQNAFTSYIAGSGTSKRAHLGICFACGDTAARAFNYLSNSDQHHRALYPSEQFADGLSNSIALYWLRGPAPLLIEEELGEVVERDFSVLADEIATPLLTRREAPAKLSQIKHLLNIPWKPVNDALTLSDYGFFLAVVSPNVGRLAIRDWISVSLKDLKDRLKRFLELTTWLTDDGQEQRPASVGQMVDAIGSDDTNLFRALLHTAYNATLPPSSLVVSAGRGLNHLLANEHALRERQRSLGFDKKPVWGAGWSHALAAAIVLGLGMKKGAEQLSDVSESLEKDIGFQCGQLLALLEEAQQVYTWRQYGHRLDTSLVQRAYGGASTTPAPFFNRFMRQANTAHLTLAGRKLNQEVNLAAERIAHLGPIPATLLPEEQAQFGLGFYTQRAKIRAWPKSDREPKEVNPMDPNQNDDDAARSVGINQGGTN